MFSMLSVKYCEVNVSTIYSETKAAQFPLIICVGFPITSKIRQSLNILALHYLATAFF